VANLTVSGKKATLEDLVMLPLGRGAVEGGDVVNPDMVANCLKAGLENRNYAKKKVAIGMFGGAVIVKKISMPKMDPKIVSEQLRWEAEQYIPFNIDEAVFDFHILNTVHQETMDILLVATRQEHIFRYFEAVEAANLTCAIVDVNGLALANCFEFNYGQPPGTTALINIGSSVTNLVILESGNVVFSRDIPYGGFLYDAEISRDLGVGQQEAESLKLGVSYQQETPQEVLAVISAVNETLSLEINNSFDFYKTSGNNLSVHQLYLSGGVVQTPGLIQKIQEVTGVPSSILDPFQKIEVNSKKFTPEMVDQIRLFSPIALGLGLRNLG
jgi:type IV pilus assembly protein PilM